MDSIALDNERRIALKKTLLQEKLAIEMEETRMKNTADELRCNMFSDHIKKKNLAIEQLGVECNRTIKSKNKIIEVSNKLLNDQIR